MVYKILFVENKEELKQYIKVLLIRILGILIPVILLLLYLIITGALQDFINYAILGIKTFSNKIGYMGLLEDDKIEIKILSVLVPISLVVAVFIIGISKILNKENENLQKLLTMFVYSSSIVIVIYPISDKIHFLIGSFISIINIIYMISLLGKIIYSKIGISKKQIKYKTITLIIWLLLLSFILAKTIDNIYIYTKIEKNTEIEHYKNIEISEDLESRIQNIDNYILNQEQEGRKVYILDAEAAVYMIPINRYNKNYDMFLKGNIGKGGEEEQIRLIEQRDKNGLYMIRKEKIKSNWQTPLNVVQYVRNNLEKIDEIEIYEIYR